MASSPWQLLVFGLAWLGATFWLNLPGIGYMVAGSLLLFVLLCNTGEFGNSPARFLSTAPSATEGSYYRSYMDPGVTNVEAYVLDREVFREEGVK